MRKKTPIIYNIKIADWLFVDPTFEQNSKGYNSYFPLSRAFTGHKLTDNMSPTCFKLVVYLLEHAHLLRKTCFDLAPDMLPTCREPVENVLCQLEQFQILSFSKEINKINKINKIKEKKLTVTNVTEDLSLTGSYNNIYIENGLYNNKASDEKFDASKFSADQVLNAWNFFCVPKGLPEAKVLTKSRKTKAQNLCNKFSKDQIETALKNLASTKWCLGDNDRKWRADIDYFLREDSFVKFLEKGDSQSQAVAVETPKEKIFNSDPFGGVAGVK